MTSFYGHLPFSASYPQMGGNEGLMAQDLYGPHLPLMLPAEAMGQALQTSSYSPEAGMSPYARGGRVQQSGFPLGELAETLRTQGQEGDTVLAHISPREAAFLAEHFGGDINPETGLPQFGFFSKLWKGVKKVAGPAIGAVLGTMVGGPLGGAIGGGIGGSFGHPNDRVGPVMGGLGGYFGGPALLKGGSALMAGQGLSGIGAGLSSGFGQSTGMLSNGLSSLLNSTGLGSFFGGGVGSSAASAASAGKDVLHRAMGASAGGGGLGSFFGGNILNNALLATAIGGTLLRREKPQGPQSIGDAMREGEKHRWRPDQYPDKDSFKPINRKYQGYSKEYRPGFDPEEEAFRENSPWQYTPRFSEQKFSEGGFLEGFSQGQEDNVPALLSEGEFVIPADVVADLGDGNSKAGAKRLEQMMREIRCHKNTTKHPPKSKGLGAYFNA
jgi:hypothetical protein